MVQVIKKYVMVYGTATEAYSNTYLYVHDEDMSLIPAGAMNYDTG